MALLLKISCSNHQDKDGTFGRERSIWIDIINERTAEQVRKILVRDGWVVQFNGEHVDTYCSKKCAE